MPNVRRLLAAMTIVSAPLAVTAGAQAEAEEHCVIDVVGRDLDGKFVTAPERCFPTFAEAMDSIDGASPGQEALGLVSFALGIHYDGTNGTGSSLTVNGDSCTGGWLNLSASWINKISSTYNGCPRIKHYDGNNLTGGVEDTTTVGTTTNLSALNNASNSIQYTS